jgi:putative hemolysin
VTATPSPAGSPRDTGQSWATLDYPPAPEALPDTQAKSGAYTLEFAQTERELDDILRLRFEVFNLELGEGLNESYITGRDEDDLDRVFHHLLIRSSKTGEVVGTYRMQTGAMAKQHAGFYSAGEFNLEGLPQDILDQAVEIGRACVAKDHRNGRVLHLLWKGLASYLTWNDKRYLFGCCSLTSQDRALGARVHAYLQREGYLWPEGLVTPLPELACLADGADDPSAEDVHIPALFQSYLNLGATVCGPPAIDTLFKTIDFLVLFDKTKLSARVYRSFFA